MLRLVVVTAALAVIAVSVLFHEFSLASAVGIIVGVIYLALAMARNDGFINASLKSDPGRPNDPNAGISMGLGASGIAAGALSRDYPTEFRYFLFFCLIAGLAIAQSLALRYRRPVAVAPTAVASGGDNGQVE